MSKHLLFEYLTWYNTRMCDQFSSTLTIKLLCKMLKELVIPVLQIVWNEENLETMRVE